MEENIRNLEKLLEETQNRSSRVIQDLDELIKSVKYMQCSSGGGGSPPPDSKDSQQQENKPRQEEQDQGLKENPSQEQADRNPRPEETRPEEGPGRQENGEKPPSPPTEQVEHADLSGRWGVLPPKIQQDILNFNIEEFPEKYRKWLEDYYKRVNQRKR
ncbi:MAG: hypothetical protein KJ645_02880 [Planctomycetes bacterium]|nr:hypothetical protein [Planctomycetota bacterium]